jgi:hypothetical protein
MPSPNEFIGEIATVRTCHEPTKAGKLWPLPAGLADGDQVRRVWWDTAPDRHCNWWCVQKVDGLGADIGEPVEDVWGNHLKRKDSRTRPPAAQPSLGVPYRAADELTSVSAPQPCEVDPAEIERGTRGHARTQNALHRHLDLLGIAAMSPSPGSPEFDIAWEHNGILYVAEVKSITPQNEEAQLRIGLGQVLRYRQALAARHPNVVAVLAPETKPSDDAWYALCRDLNVVLAPPPFRGLVPV